MLTGDAKCKCKLQKWRKSSFSLARNPCSAGKKLSHSGLGIARSSSRRSRSKGGTSRKSFSQVCIVQQRDLHRTTPALCSFVFPVCHTCIFATFFRWYFPVLPARPLFPALYPSPPEALEPEVQHLRIAERGAHSLHFTRLDATFGRRGAKNKEMLKMSFFYSFCLERNPFVAFHQTYCYIWLLAGKNTFWIFLSFLYHCCIDFSADFLYFCCIDFPASHFTGDLMRHLADGKGSSLANHKKISGCSLERLS